MFTQPASTELKQWLLKLRAAGKKTFLLTSSYIDYGTLLLHRVLGYVHTRTKQCFNVKYLQNSYWVIALGCEMMSCVFSSGICCFISYSFTHKFLPKLQQLCNFKFCLVNFCNCNLLFIFLMLVQYCVICLFLTIFIYITDLNGSSILT